MKVVLLAGGFGTRISEETVSKPKPMIEIGGMPILWHIMKYFYCFGHSEFIICAGYKQEAIKEWFSNYSLLRNDVTYHFGKERNSIEIRESRCEEWDITIVDTGLNTMTGGRIKRIQPYIKDEPFFMTYGDGVCDVDLNELIAFHKRHNRIATLTSVKRQQTKGVLNIAENNTVKAFREKSINDGVSINAGYMILNPKVFNYIEGDNTVFEREPLEKLASEEELMSFSHTGFWQCMDNAREKEILEKMYKNGTAPWKKWGN